MNENMNWCKPYVSADESIYVIVTNEKIVEIYEDGKRKLVNAESVHQLAVKLNEYYEDYSGYDDIYILLDAMEEIGCDRCPAREHCEAYAEELRAL